MAVMSPVMLATLREKRGLHCARAAVAATMANEKRILLGGRKNRFRGRELISKYERVVNCY